MLTVIVGLPRSGKSTWIKNNKCENDVVISNDWIRENILGNAYVDAANPVIWLVTDSCIRILLSQGVNVILDGINHTRYIRKLFLDIGKTYSVDTRIVFLNTPLDVCLERNKDNTKLPPEKLMAMYNQMEKPTMYECDHFVEVPDPADKVVGTHEAEAFVEGVAETIIGSGKVMRMLQKLRSLFRDPSTIYIKDIAKEPPKAT